MTLFERIDELKELLDRKDALAAETKENNAAIEELKLQIAEEMITEECPRISRNGFVYSLQEKTIYSKKGEDKLMEEGIDFFEVLRNEGLGDLIVETVNSRTLQSSMKQYVEENGGLSEDLEKCISVYETYDIGKRKETSKAGKKGA